MASPSQLHNVELEKAVIASLLQSPDTWGEVGGIMEASDFSGFHRSIFSVAKLQLDAIPAGSVSPVVLAERLNAIGVNDFDGVKPIDYLTSLAQFYPVDTAKGGEIAGELKKWTVRRELIKRCDDAKRLLSDQKTIEKPIDEIVGIVDKSLADIGTKYYRSETENIFGEGLIQLVEDRADNPIKPEEFGFLGPFASINRSIGSISFPGAFSLFGARSGAGKSSLSFFYNTFVAEKYNLPVLHLDAAEMTLDQLQMRAVCCLSNGRIPLWAVKSGEWRKNKEWTQIIQDDIWPRVKKLRFYYKNVGLMDKDEFISYIRRFYYKHVGRNNHLLINWDYIKGVEAIGHKTQEHQAVGYLVNGLKDVITDEIEASVTAGVQTNRAGVVTGKSGADVNDSEDALSLSDRIIQMSTNGFILRYKTSDELAEENSAFGNMVLKSLKERELLGRHYEEMLKPVRLPNGKLVKNYFNLQCTNFSYSDMGSLIDMSKSLGWDKVIIDPKKNGKAASKVTSF